MRISDWSSDLCSSDLIRWTIVPLCDRVQSRASANHQDGPMSTRPRTLYEKIWDAHVVDRREDGTCLIYIDRHLVHEVTSPQAFEGLRAAGRRVRRPDLTLAVPAHNLATTPHAPDGGSTEESRGGTELVR